MEECIGLLSEKARREIVVPRQPKKVIPLLNIRELFLREIAEQWTNINFTEKNLDFNSSCIWHNSLIRIESRPFFFFTEHGLTQGRK